MKTIINPCYKTDNKNIKTTPLKKDSFKINYISSREGKYYNIPNVSDDNISFYIPFAITRDISGAYIKNNAPTNINPVSFTAYINESYSSITYTGLIPVKCLLKYFSYGLDVITGQYMSGDKVYIKIYNNSASTVYEAIGINPEIVTLVPGNVMMITGVRYFDTNIAIFFEVFQ